MADGPSAFDVFGAMGTALGMGLDLKSIFSGDNTPSAGQIAALVAQEVEEIFFEQSADNLIADAAARLDTVRMFLTMDYANAQAAGESNADLWSLLDQSSSSPGIANLEDAQNALSDWLQTNTGNPPGGSGTYATRAASVGLGLAVHICLLHRERAKVAPDSQTQAAELADMSQMARLAIGQFQPAVEEAINGRGMGLQELNGTWTDQDSGNEWAMTRIPDSWLAEDPAQLWVETDLTQTGKDAGTALAQQALVMDPVHAVYRKVLWDARPDDCTTLQASFPSGAFTPNFDYTNGPDFSAKNFDNICAFGQWVSAARVTIMGLDLTGTGLTGQQEDEWRVCMNCNALFRGLDDLACPAGGVHNSDWSPNFVLHQQVASASSPPSSESSWAQCTQCHGLFRGGTSNVCASGGPHAAGGSYFMCYGEAPSADNRGITNAQQGFLCCQECGLLYFPSGTNLGSFLNLGSNGVCPAGGPHDTSPGLPAPYWLSWIAMWKGGVPLFGTESTKESPPPPTPRRSSRGADSTSPPSRTGSKPPQ